VYKRLMRAEVAAEEKVRKRMVVKQTRIEGV
jgi:hypothetical protein